MRRRGTLIALAALLLPASAWGLTTNQTVLVDRPSGDAPLPYDGAGRGFVAPKAISADGCYVVFVADSDPLFAGDDNGARNIYRLSRCGAGGLVLVNASASGAPAEFGSQNTSASIPADGNRISFTSTSATLEPESNGSTQVYVKDLTSGALQIVSRGDGPTGSITQEANSGMISADGQHVAFIARGVLDTDNVNGVAGTYDVYERSLPDATTHMVSVTYPGELEGGGIASFLQPGISHDGKIVSFDSGSKLTADDTDAGGDAYVRQGLNGGSEVTRLVSFSSGQTAGADGVFGGV